MSSSFLQVITIFLFTGLIFIPVGLVTLRASHSVISHSMALVISCGYLFYFFSSIHCYLRTYLWLVSNHLCLLGRLLKLWNDMILNVYQSHLESIKFRISRTNQYQRIVLFSWRWSYFLCWLYIQCEIFCFLYTCSSDHLDLLWESILHFNLTELMHILRAFLFLA